VSCVLVSTDRMLGQLALSRSRCRLGALGQSHVDPRNHIIDGGPYVLRVTRRGSSGFMYSTPPGTGRVQTLRQPGATSNTQQGRYAAAMRVLLQYLIQLVTPPPLGEWRIVMIMSVCVCVSETTRAILPNVPFHACSCL